MTDSTDATEKPQKRVPQGASDKSMTTKNNKRAQNPRRARFIEEMGDADVTPTEAARRAGYKPSHARWTGHLLMKEPEVVAAIEDKRSAAMREAGVTAADAWRALKRYSEDGDGSWRRAPAVRASELILKGAGELGPDVEVDARSLVLPELSISEIRAQLAAGLHRSSEEGGRAGEAG